MDKICGSYCLLLLLSMSDSADPQKYFCFEEMRQGRKNLIALLVARMWYVSLPEALQIYGL